MLIEITRTSSIRREEDGQPSPWLDGTVGKADVLLELERRVAAREPGDPSPYECNS